MIRTYKVLLIVGLTIFGVWGCGKSTSTSEGGSPTAKIAKLEDELKAATAARDSFRQKLADSENANRAESARYQALAKERDELQGKLARKGDEYKELQVQYDGFRKNLKELIGQAEVAIEPKAKGVTATPVSLTKDAGK